MVTGVRAVEAAENGVPMYVHTMAGKWVPAGKDALTRAKRLLPDRYTASGIAALSVYGCRARDVYEHDRKCLGN
jgi:hypothetical protein